MERSEIREELPPERRNSRIALCSIRATKHSKIKTPRFPGAFRVQPISAESRFVSGGGFRGRAVAHLRSLRVGGDRNAAGLLGLGDLADEIDVEQAVLERSALHHDEIGKLEYPLEGARRDAAIQHLGLVPGVFIG